jgi:hypothetical protein
MKTRIEARRTKVIDLDRGDVISVAPDLQYSPASYNSEDNLVARVLAKPEKHPEYNEYWVIHTNLGEYFVYSTGYVQKLTEVVLYGGK